MVEIVAGVLMTAFGVAVTVIVGRSTDRKLNKFVERLAEPTFKVVGEIAENAHRLGNEVQALNRPLADLSTAIRTTSTTLERLVQAVQQAKGK